MLELHWQPLCRWGNYVDPILGPVSLMYHGIHAYACNLHPHWFTTLSTPFRLD